jgi:ABC-2 type transport system permease protein
LNVLGVLLRFRLRRDRIQLAVWAVALFALTLLVVMDVRGTFSTAAERAATLRLLMATPAVLLFRGTPQGIGEGDFVAVLGISFLALLVGLMCTFLVVRHTRAEEERGRTELLAAAAGRRAPVLAVVVEGVVASGLATAAVAAGCLAGGLPVVGSWLLGAGCGTTGLAFVGIALLLAQVLPTSRSANGWSATLVVAAYLLRGIGDAAGTPRIATFSLTPALPSWFSPIGWAQAVHPFAEDRPWPLLLGVATFLVSAGIAVALQARRDTGMALLAERRGRTSAPRTLNGPVGLAVRLERAGLVGWVVAVGAFGALLGGLSVVVVQQLQNASPGIAAAIDAMGGGAGTVRQAFTGLGAAFCGLLASAVCVLGAQRLRQEEVGGGMDAVLSTATGRVRWMLSILGVAALGATAALVLGGLAAAALAGGGQVGSMTWFAAVVWELPAALVFLGLGALVFAVRPAATVPVGWLLLAAAAFFGLYGPVLGLPEWTRQLAPFAHSPAVAAAGADFAGAWAMVGAAVVLVAAATWLFRRRDTVPVG